MALAFRAAVNRVRLPKELRMIVPFRRSPTMSSQTPVPILSVPCSPSSNESQPPSAVSPRRRLADRILEKVAAGRATNPDHEDRDL